MVGANRSYKKRGSQPEQKKKIKFENWPRLTYEQALRIHQPAIDLGANCEACPLFMLRGVGPVYDEVVEDATLTVVMEAPGEEECKVGRPAVGKSGKVVISTLLDGGVAREECTISNSCLCRPPEDYKAYEHRLKLDFEEKLEKWKNEAEKAKKEGLEVSKAPEKDLTPAQCCYPRLKNSLEQSKSKFILALGGAALRSLAQYFDVPYGSSKKVKYGDAKLNTLKKQLGSPATMPDGSIIVATYHPAFAMRKGSRQYMHVVKEHIVRAAKIARRGHIDWKEPPYFLNPTVEVIEEVLGRMRAASGHVTVDIETDKGSRPDGGFDPYSCRIRCIGFGSVINGEEVVITVPIRRINGDEWWAKEDKLRVLQTCINVLNYNPLVGHNFAFDSQVLLRHKLISEENRARPYDDTAIMHHDTPDNDLPHDLGFVGARYFEVPSWKGAGDDKHYERVTDDDLHLYCSKDVVVEMRLFDTLTQEIYRYGTRQQYEIDKMLAPSFRDAGCLGLFIDEIERGRLSEKLDVEVHTRRLQLQKLCGNPKFNPNSPPQIRKFLFGEKKLIPVINTKQKDWEEGEDASTNAASLTGITAKQAVDETTKEFINVLLEYKAFTKLKGTYVDNLKVTFDDWEKKYGIKIAMAPAVYGTVWHKFKKADIEARLIKQCGSIEAWKSFSKTVRKALVASEPDGEWVKEIILPERPAISRLYTSYNTFTIPSGRVSTKPAIQNWTITGKVDTRMMVIAPPGHVLVGADFDQVELRIYAVLSGDLILLKAFRENKDPHSYNAASLFMKKFGKSIDETYEIIVNLPELTAKEYAAAAYLSDEVSPDVFTEMVRLMENDGNTDVESLIAKFGVTKKFAETFYNGCKKGMKEKKGNRGYAKTFAYLECIAENSLVLTDHGLVPIQDVQLSDRLWDGIEWVSHDGIIFKGEKEVITYDGLTATPEHKVWATTGENLELQEAQRKGARLARTGTGRNPIHFLDDNIESLARTQSSKGRSSMQMWRGANAVSRQFTRRKDTRMSFVLGIGDGIYSGMDGRGMRKLRETEESIRSRQRSMPKLSKYHEDGSELAVHSREGSETTMHESERPIMEELRRSRNSIPVQFISGDGAISIQDISTLYGTHNRSHRQRRSILTRECTHDNGRKQCAESTQVSSTRRVEIQSGGMAVCPVDRVRPTLQRTNKTRDLGPGSRDCKKTKRKVASSRTTAKVYDLLNAGPRHRFTVGNILAGNCYGGEADKLFAYMSTARHKATGELLFKDIKKSDVTEWHDAWHAGHPETREWQRTCAHVASIEGFTATVRYAFRKRFFIGGANKEGATFNHCAQGLAAEFANEAWEGIGREIPYQCWSPFTGLMIQCHDQIVVCVPAEYEQRAIEIVERNMNKELMGVKISAKARSTKNWSAQG